MLANHFEVLGCIRTSITLHYVTLHYMKLHYIKLRYVTLRYITVHYIRTYSTYVHTYVHTYIHTYMHTYIHTDRQTYTFNGKKVKMCASTGDVACSTFVQL